MRNFLRRAGWLSLAILFIGTGLGVGVWAFWQNTHQKPPTSQTTPPPPPPNPNALAGKKLSGFTPTDKVDSLQIVDLKQGDGATVQPGSTITVDYTGAVAATGVVFQSSLDSGRPLTIKLDQVISGWIKGLPGMKVGGQRRLIIPAADAYGANPPAGSGIPPNAGLVFDVTIHDAK